MIKRIRFLLLGISIILPAAGLPAQQVERADADQMSAARPEAVRRVAVLGFEALGTSEQIAALAQKSLEEALFDIEGIVLVERERVELVLAEQEFQLSDLADQQNAVEIGRLLAADTITLGSVQQLDGLSISVKLIDVETGSVLFVDSRNASTREVIPEVIRRIARESERALFSGRFLNPLITVRLAGGICLPAGPMRELVRMGYSGNVEVSIANAFVNHLILGLQSRFSYFPGREENTRYFISIPVFVTGGYRFLLPNKSTITPRLSAGLAVDLLSWDEDGFVAGFEDPDYSLSVAASPALQLSVAVGFPLGGILVELGSDATVVVERSNTMVSLGAALGVSLAF